MSQQVRVVRRRRGRRGFLMKKVKGSMCLTAALRWRGGTEGVKSGDVKAGWQQERLDQPEAPSPQTLPHSLHKPLPAVTQPDSEIWRLWTVGGGALASLAPPPCETDWETWQAWWSFCEQRWRTTLSAEWRWQSQRWKPDRANENNVNHCWKHNRASTVQLGVSERRERWKVNLSESGN